MASPATQQTGEKAAPIGRSWLWPDHVIGKRESRQLREEHNALVNSHADMRDALKQINVRLCARGGPTETELAECRAFAQRAIAKAEGRTP
jgi:hypothetical protein